jgi:protein ImuB
MERRQDRVACLWLPNAGTRELTAIRELAEACLRFTPQVAVRGDEAVFLHIGACRQLFTEDWLLLRMRALAKRFGCPTPRIAIANDAPTALAMARFGEPDARKLPLEALADYASPFALDEETHKKSALIVRLLKELGLRTLEDFSKLPAGSLASRFGREGAELSREIEDNLKAPWPMFRVPEQVCEQTTLEDVETLGAVAGLEPLFFVLKTVIDRAMARLRARGLRAARVDLTFTLERPHVPRSWAIALPLPQGSAHGLLPILRDRLYHDLERRPLAAPVTAARLTVIETAPGHGAQKDFFNRREEEAEAWDALVARLSEKLGRNRAFMAMPVDRHLPEGTWMPVLEMRETPKPKRPRWSAAESSAALDLAAVAAAEFAIPDEPARPLRLLPKPERIRLQGDILARAPGKRWRALEWHGPERLSGEWWLDARNARGFARDYYRVVTESGEQLWVFQTSRQSELYLHGYFD